ncbi:MAG: glycosyltransferase [Bacteroidetes bacterium]|nr:glycosyltransferase [Bacteroidota bacterium]
MEGRPNILHIVPSYKPAWIYGGPIMSVSELCQWESHTGQEVSVYTTTANGKEELPVQTGVPIDVEGVSVFYFNRWTKDHTHFSPALFLKLWKNAKNFDCIHIHSWWNLLTLFSVFVLFLQRKKYILSPRGMLSPYTLGHSGLKRKFLKFPGKFLLKNAVFHATSPQEASELKALFPQNQITCLPNFVKIPDPVFSHNPKSEPDILNLLFLSRIDPKKGLERSFLILSELTREWTLTLAGTGNPNYILSLKEYAVTLGIENKLSWKGHVGGKDKFQLYADHDFLILLSENENFANVVAESVAMGTPVLISPQVGLSDWITETQTGWVLKDKNKLVDLLSTLQSINQISENTRKNGYRLVKEAFYSVNLAKKYVNFYQSLVKQ